MAKGGGGSGRLRPGATGFLSMGRGEGLAARILGVARRTVTVQWLQGYGRTGGTDTYMRRPGQTIRPFTDREQNIYGG